MTQMHSVIPSRDRDQAVLDVQGLEVAFATDRGMVSVTQDVSLAVHAGQTMGLVGESGSGKSVTALAIMGLIPTPPGRIATGEVWFNGTDLVRLGRKQLRALRGDAIAMIFQEPMTSLNPAFTVGEQIAEVVRRHRSVKRKEAWNRAVEALGTVGIPNPRERAKDYPHAFSGGMRQRVMIAMAIVCEPELLIADEPTTALDVTVQAQILGLLSQLQDELGMAMIFVTHDLGVVADTCDEVTVMYAGRVVEVGPTQQVFESPTHPYTEGLLRAMPQASIGRDRMLAISGSVPAPHQFPPGCRFHTRCDYAVPGQCDGPTPRLLPAAPAQHSRCLRVDEIVLQGVES